MKKRRSSVVSVAIFGLLGGIAQVALAAPAASLEHRFATTVRPFVDRYCGSCHGAEKPKAELDLTRYSTLRAVLADGQWSEVHRQLGRSKMPPENAEQPSPQERAQVLDWIQAAARSAADDPGPVLARRLSNAEYSYTIRDLTGIDIRPSREFPIDPANPAGFDNSGESLAMSPALLGKYLQAAREVASHLVLGAEGIAFAPHPMLVETDRDKYCVNRIVDFYKRQNTDYADYFLAAWRYRHRAALGKPRATLATVAADSQVSPRYLTTIWGALGEAAPVGPMARLQAMWRQLPVPRQGARSETPTAAAAKMRDFVVALRKKIEPRFDVPSVPGMNRTAQPLLMWRNRQYASHRMTYDRAALQIDGQVTALASAPRAKPSDEDDDQDDGPAPRPGGLARDPDLVVPAADRARYEAAFARFAAVFPDAFYISERGRNYHDKSKERGRLLSAGFHNLMGYFRDDEPLSKLVLDEAGQKQLDALWRELDYVAAATSRTYVQFYFNASGQARNRGAGATPPEDREITSPAAIARMKEVFLAQAKPSGNPVATQAVLQHFDWVNASLRWVEQARLSTEPRHLEGLLEFAGRAYRRPLTGKEREALTGYYRSLRSADGLAHEEAMRDVLVSVLMSPDFCYRIDLVDAGEAVRPLSDFALASRLSYFLWSSMPDAELLAHARAGDLHRPAVLAAQARRMLKDDRVRGLVTEFAGNWLDFRRFEEHNAVDRERFASFDDELRRAMFEEPIRFTLDVVKADRSVLDLLFARRTFVNRPLARHYGMPDPAGGPEVWVPVPDAERYGRGGLLPMAVFLTKNAPGLRTSPVKRGYWVVKNVLGERIPPPPAAVPELPRDEAKMDLPMRETLAAHREDASCAGCHARFDSMGLVFEGYGPVGERRAQDLAGRPVDARASFPDRSTGDGLAGLLRYVRERRQDDFVENLSRKLLAYALGRSLILSDDVVVARMKARLSGRGFRFHELIESVVTSPQFLSKRGREALATR